MSIFPGCRIPFFGGVGMFQVKKYIAFSLLLCTAVTAGAMLLSRLGTASAVWSEEAAPVVVIDAGHGGEDGGATSVTGLRESSLNLEISLRLRDFLNFLGTETCMVRCSDVSIYTEGATIAQKKVSDIHNRLRLVNSVQNALLVSIHQNFFPEAQYRGAQIFYGSDVSSRKLAVSMQEMIASQVDSRNHRECRPARDIYLMDHVSCPAVLVECGFLSNYEEERLLREPGYQKKLTAALGCCIFQFLEASNEV